MRYGVIELFHQRYIAFAHVIVVVRTHQVLFSRKSSRLAHSLIGCFHIKVAQTLHPGIHNHRQTGVTFHCEGFTSVQLPFRQPPMLFVHIDHGTYHVNLTFGIHQSHQLMQVTIGIPQRIYGVTVVFSRLRFSGFHGWVFPVYILEDVRVNQRVIQGSIEHRFLFLCTSFYGDTAQIVVPLFPCTGIDFIESSSMLLSFQILTGIFHTYKRYTYGHFYLFIFFCIESEPCTDVVASQIPVILRVQLVFAIVFIPFCFHPGHLALEFPIPRLLRSLVDTHDKVDWKYCLRIIAERSQELHTLNFTVIYPAQISSRFIGQSFS